MAGKDQETQPRTMPLPPPVSRWRQRWRGVRYHIGTAGLIVVIVVILAGMAVISSMVPAVRHGVGKIVTRHGPPVVKTQLMSPSLRDGSPSLDPSSFTRSPASRPVLSRTATTAPARSRAAPSPARRATPTPAIRVTPSATPTVTPTTSSAPATPSTTAPPPTTPAPTTPSSTPTSATPAATATGAAPSSS